MPLDLMQQAAHCERVADELSTVCHPLPPILEPVRELHHPATWASSAAERSRATLVLVHQRELAAMADGVLSLQARLRHRAALLRID